MKRLTITIASILLCSMCVQAQTDSSKVLRDSLYAIKANYIGQPLSKLITDLGGDVHFGTPDNGSTRTKGTAYYEEVYIYFKHTLGHPIYGFIVTLSQRVNVDLGHRASIGLDAWDNEMKVFLGVRTVAALEKW